MVFLFTWNLTPFPQDGSSGNLNSKTLRNVPRKGTGLPVAELDDFDPAYISRKEIIRYVRPLTSVIFTVELPYLDDIDTQHILAWKLQFLEAVQVCECSPEHAADDIPALSSLKIRKSYTNSTEANSMLYALIQKISLDSAERFHKNEWTFNWITSTTSQITFPQSMPFVQVDIRDQRRSWTRFGQTRSYLYAGSVSWNIRFHGFTWDY